MRCLQEIEKEMARTQKNKVGGAQHGGTCDSARVQPKLSHLPLHLPLTTAFHTLLLPAGHGRPSGHAQGEGRRQGRARFASPLWLCVFPPPWQQ